jgi:hypothetical protein
MKSRSTSPERRPSAFHVVCLVVASLVSSVVVAGCEPAPAAAYRDFPLRISYAGGVQLSPAYEANAVVACWTVSTNKNMCRHIYGYEETDTGFTYHANNISAKKYARHEKYGWELTMKDGRQYEGCVYRGDQSRSGYFQQTWTCDYRSAWHTYYTGEFSYVKTFVEWGTSVRSQVYCAAAWGGLWSGSKPGAIGWAAMVDDCLKKPYNPSRISRSAPTSDGGGVAATAGGRIPVAAVDVSSSQMLRPSGELQVGVRSGVVSDASAAPRSADAGTGTSLVRNGSVIEEKSR